MNSNPYRHGGGSRIVVVLLSALVLISNCAAGGKGKAQKGLEQRTLDFELAGGGRVSLEAEIAKTKTERETGLMFRTELPDGTGMLFVFEVDDVLSFWMKDTLVPLSIAFINYDGIILEIKDMHPRDLSSVHSSRSVRYALEVPQGWFSRAGIKTGDRISGL
jgi:uncharacterized membrane protein (UPF0127 family)